MLHASHAERPACEQHAADEHSRWMADTCYRAVIIKSSSIGHRTLLIVYENHHACPAYVFEYRCPSLHGANPYGTNLKPANAPGCLLRMEKAPMFFNAGSSTALTARRIYLDMYSFARGDLPASMATFADSLTEILKSNVDERQIYQ